MGGWCDGAGLGLVEEGGMLMRMARLVGEEGRWVAVMRLGGRAGGGGGRDGWAEVLGVEGLTVVVEMRGGGVWVRWMGR